MEYVAPIIQSIASLFWVSFALAALFLFKPDISRILSRPIKGNFFGNEVEFGPELRKLEASADATLVEAQELPSSPSQDPTTDQGQGVDHVVLAIVQQAATAPKLALILLAAELERQARQTLAIYGMLNERRFVSLNQAFGELARYGFPPNLLGSLKLFLDIRNKIVHGGSSTSDDDALRALDSGITILRALSALPKEAHVVYHPGVPLFSDANAQTPIPNAKGVILETTSPGGVGKAQSIFPTTKTHFQKGKEVAWEWNMRNVWNDAWYRDPDSNEIKLGWNSAAEFVGRHLDEV